MKKRLAMLLAAVMICSGLSVFALTPEDFNEAMNAPMTSTHINMTLKAELTEMDKDVFKSVTGMELSAMPGMTLDYDMDLVMNETGTKMQAKVDVSLSTVPALPLVGKNLCTTYVDLDLTDTEKPVYKIIVKTNDTEKYLVMDYTKLPGFDEMIKWAQSMTPENEAQMNEQLNKFLPEIKPEYKGNSAVIKMNDAQVKEYFAGAMKGMQEVMGDLFSSTFTFINVELPGVSIKTPAELQQELMNKMNEIGAALNEVKLFAEDGLTATVTLDDSAKHMKSMDCVIKLDTNLNELVSKVGKAMDVPEAQMDEALKLLPADKSNVKAQLSLNMEFSKVNEDIKIELPTLTEENSVNLTNSIVYDLNAVNVYYDGKKVDFKDVQPVMENDRTLVPIRHFCNALGIKDEDIQYNDGIVTIKNGDTIMTLTIDKQDVTIEQGGETKTVTLDVPATERDGRTLVPLRFISENFGCKVSFEEFKDADGKVTGSLITIVPDAEK